MTTMSKVYQIGSKWPGFPAIRKLFVFGDSYSSVLTAYFPGRPAIRPSAAMPLGVPFPGEMGGHFIAKHCPRPRYKPDQEHDSDYATNPLLVYDYAIGGNTVSGVKSQLSSFLDGAGAKPDWASWSERDSLFVTWIGINDCAYSIDHSDSMKTLFDIQQKLYDAGARNFLFIDVPPIHKSPAVSSYLADSASVSYHDWNSCLAKALGSFASSHPDTTVMLFSSYQTFCSIFDNPVDHGFEEKDLRKRGGAIWYDHLHPTSAVHDIIAAYLADFLSEVTPAN
ncbi:uncharacterized protein EV420DRAFT_1629173 [Desarmillaria tabescens]|uniref:Carbohydrate esterase family 16 protein n=1 Tax=Armillaria tabescens TaxID=1929756 RepID=A0AA39KH30_ARMTA|nr:uncharacterized protein EV420DRAFT_1629173 [Desarmillaria tabescens]KAK0459791.1 hypothetical protein EV420DRAFT_1629173 [Desarmillaria tabescens]